MLAAIRIQLSSATVKPNGVQRDTPSEIKVDPAPTQAARPTVDAKAKTDRVSIGDTVRVRYLTDDKRIVQFTISAERSDPSNNVIHCKTPIAEALLGAEEGDEAEILVRSYLKLAILEKIISRLH